jgi:hypothetical protein
MQFVGTPTLTDNKIAVLKEWYIAALGDGDKADAIEDCLYYNGMSDGLEDSLKLLHNMVPSIALEAAEVAKKSHSFKKPLIVIGVGVGIYVLWNYKELKARVQAKNNEFRTQAQESAKIRKIQEGHTEN